MGLIPFLSFPFLSFSVAIHGAAEGDHREQ